MTQELQMSKQAIELRMTCALFLGLTKEVAEVIHLFQGIESMRDSSVYQMILAEGRAEGETMGELNALRRVLLRLGKQRFGPLWPEDEAVLNSITDPARLERMIEYLFQAANWNDLLKIQ